MRRTRRRLRLRSRRRKVMRMRMSPTILTQATRILTKTPLHVDVS